MLNACDSIKHSGIHFFLSLLTSLLMRLLSEKYFNLSLLISTLLMNLIVQCYQYFYGNTLQ